MPGEQQKEPEKNNSPDKEETPATQKEPGGNITSPEGILMLCVAVIFDIIGLIPGVGDISDILAGAIIGGWMLTKKGGRKALSRFAVAFILGLIPIVSDITPFISLLSGGKIPASWIGCVYLTLKDL